MNVYEQLARLVQWHPSPWTIEKRVEIEAIISKMFPQDGDVVDYVRLEPDLSRPNWIVLMYKIGGNWRWHPAVITPADSGFAVSLMDYWPDKRGGSIKGYFNERLLDIKDHLGVS